MKDVLVLLATMGGGLGCFLLGMKHLSEGLQSVGGAGLKRFMSAMTTNRIAGMVTGVVSTIIVQVRSARLPVSVAEYARALLRIADEYESLSDEFPVIVKAYRRVKSGDAPWPVDSRAAVLGILKDLDAFQLRVLAAFMAGKHLRESVLAELSVTSKGLRRAIRAARESQLQRIGDAESAPLVALATLDIFNALDRARSCLINIAETLAGGKRTASD